MSQQVADNQQAGSGFKKADASEAANKKKPQSIASRAWSMLPAIKPDQITVRLATLKDVDDLLKVEASAFPNPEHQAKRETIERRIRTSPKTTIIAFHKELGVVGSLYSRPVNHDEIVRMKYSWNELNNNGDFTPPKDFDSCYTIGLQTMRGVRGVAKHLELVGMQFAAAFGATYVFGGPRLPGYHKSDLPIEQYIASGKDKVLSSIVNSATVPGVMKCEVVCPLVNYWDDPDSRNYAALIRVKIPTVLKMPGVSTVITNLARRF